MELICIDCEHEWQADRWQKCPRCESESVYEYGLYMESQKGDDDYEAEKDLKIFEEIDNGKVCD